MPEPISPSDRRRYPRFATAIPLLVQPIGEDLEEDEVLETINLSAGGALCRVSRHLPPMTTLVVRGELRRNGASRTIRVEAVVVRIDPEVPREGCRDYRVALFFRSLSDADRQALQSFLQGS